MQTFAKYSLTFLILVAAGCLLLFFAGLAPDGAVQENIAASAAQLQSEGLHPGVLYDGHPRSTLDNYSEFQILLRSYYMDTRADALAILENPGYHEDGTALSEDAQVRAYLDAIADDAPSNSNYVRYWMGFRAIVRPLLALMNYMDARQLLLWTFCLLLGAVSLLLYKKTGSFWLALSFVFAISQLNPAAITGCFQFSICFLLAFTGMLLTLSLRFSRISAPLLFFILGAATQYFDFYTAPLVCFGLPMLSLLLRRQYEKDADFSIKTTLRLMLSCFASWLGAYLLMWLAKLALTTALTDVDAFSDAFSRVRLWLFERSPEGAEAVSIPKALFYCAINLADTVPLLAEIVLLIAYGVHIVRTRPPRAAFSDNLIYLTVGLLPLLWIAAAAKPSYNHAYFQYRILGVSFYAVLVFCINTARAGKLRER